MQDHFSLLGFKVKDSVTGFKGVCTSICFDLYGCVQGLVTTPVTEKNGEKKADSWWFDTKRLVRESDYPVMAVPHFVSVPGPEFKPPFESKPL